MVELYVMDTRCFSDKELFADVYRWLSQYRKNKIDSYVQEKDKFLSMGAGYMLEYGMRNLDLPLQYGHIDYGRYGKPKLKTNDNVRVFNFNLSHSGVYAVCAFSSAEIGVDIQIVSPKISEKALWVACSSAEYKRLSEMDEDRRRNEFYRLWTVKESFMKYLGTGLSLPPSSIETDFGQHISVKMDGKKQNVFFKEFAIEGYKLTACSGADVFAPNFKEVKVDRSKLK